MTKFIPLSKGYNHLASFGERPRAKILPYEPVSVGLKTPTWIFHQGVPLSQNGRSLKNCCLSENGVASMECCTEVSNKEMVFVLGILTLCFLKRPQYKIPI